MFPVSPSQIVIGFMEIVGAGLTVIVPVAVAGVQAPNE